MRGPRANNQGFVVVLALIALMAMSFFLMTGASTTTSAVKVSGNYNRTIETFNVAEVGLAKARPMIEGQTFSTLLVNYQYTPLIGTTAFNDSTYTVSIANNAADPGGVASDTDNIIVVKSTAQLPSGSKVVIQTHVQKVTTVSFPPSPGSGPTGALLCGTASEVRTSGSGTISGHDFTPPTIPCVGIACNGVDGGGTGLAVVGESTVNTSGSGYVSNQSPAVVQNAGAGAACNSWQTLYNQYASLSAGAPNVVMLTGSEINDTNLNTCTSPKVFIINTTSATFRFKGQTSLCGVIIVASNTSIETVGSVTIIGLVLNMSANADFQFTSSTGTPQLFGEIVTKSTSVDTPKELTVTGSSRINYSAAGLGYASQALAGTSGGGGSLYTVAWEEKY